MATLRPLSSRSRNCGGSELSARPPRREHRRRSPPFPPRSRAGKNGRARLRRPCRSGRRASGHAADRPLRHGDQASDVAHARRPERGAGEERLPRNHSSSSCGRQLHFVARAAAPRRRRAPSRRRVRSPQHGRRRPAPADAARAAAAAVPCRCPAGRDCRRGRPRASREVTRGTAAKLAAEMAN